MAQNGGLKSLGEAKTSSRQLANRMLPPTAAPEPRDLCGNKRIDPAAAGGLLWRRVDGGESGTLQPFVATYSIRDDSQPPSKQGRRRCYTDEERLRVANTRRRGACETCRATKIRCLHDSSAIATDQYQMQSESHEIFALGLTTSSLTANEDGHKQVIKQTIAAIDNKLVNAHEGPVGQNGEANNEGSTNVRVVVSPPEPTISNELSSQQCNSSTKPHHVNAPPATYKQGVNVFRAFDGRKQKPCKTRLPNKDCSTVAVNTSLGMRNAYGGKAQARSQPIVCQKSPVGDMISSTIKQPYREDLTSWRSDNSGPLVDRSPTTPKGIQPGCKAIQASLINNHLKAPSALSFQSKPDLASPPTKIPASSSQEGNTRVKDENATSLRRQLSQTSERTSSNPPSFVHLSELSLSRSSSPDVDIHEAPVAISLKYSDHKEATSLPLDMFAMQDSFSYTAFLNDGVDVMALSDTAHTCFAASQGGLIPLHGDATMGPFTESETASIFDLMDLDDPL